MALQASGPLSSADILTELNLPPGTSISSADQRIKHLANKASGSVSSSDFYGRLPYRVVDTAEGMSNMNTYTFSGVDFGPFFAGRVLLAVTSVFDTENQVLDQSSCTIGGVVAVGDDAGFGSEANGAAGAGQWLVDDTVTATSGDVTFTTSNAPQRVGLIMIALDNINIMATSQTSGQTTGGGTSTASANVTKTTDGWLINVLGKRNGSVATFNNATKRSEVTVNSSIYSMAVAIDNKTTAGVVSLSCSWSGTTSAGAEGRTYNEA